MSPVNIQIQTGSCQFIGGLENTVVELGFCNIIMSRITGKHTCDSSRIVWEAPGNEDHLPASRKASRISRMLNFPIIFFQTVRFTPKNMVTTLMTKVKGIKTCPFCNYQKRNNSQWCHFRGIGCSEALNWLTHR